MSVKVFMQFILLIIITGGGYAYYMRDQIHFDNTVTPIISPMSPHEGDTFESVRNDLNAEPKFDSGDKFMDFNKKAYYDIRTDLSNNKITEEDANERIKVIKDRILRNNGIDPSIAFSKRTNEEQEKITNLLADFDPDMSQRQLDIATDKAVVKVGAYYNKIGIAAKIAAFFSPKDSQIGNDFKKISAESDRVQREAEESRRLNKEFNEIMESTDDDHTKMRKVEKLTGQNIESEVN